MSTNIYKHLNNKILLTRQEMSELEIIKSKFQKMDSKRWWGDDFDVRFFLVNIVKKIEKSIVLDIGGGVGIILSEIPESNLRINVDLSFEDLVKCKKEFSNVECICTSMNFLPFKMNTIEYVICANLLEVAKTKDIESKKVIINDEGKYYQTVIETLKEIKYVLQNNGKMFLTTPNNKYYKTTKFEYKELKDSLSNVFDEFSIKFFNTFKKLSERHRKLNLANVMPKMLSKFSNRNKILNSLIADMPENEYSVSFYVEVIKIDK